MKNPLTNLRSQLAESLRKLNLSPRTSRRGFTLLLAALVASIALSLGSSIYDIVLKELSLSSVGQNSQYAFYAADTAAECALYWDTRFNWFSTTTPGQVAKCDRQIITLLSPPGRASSYTPTSTMEFEVNLFTDLSAGYCADVSVLKAQTGSVIRTEVIANGYSVSCATISTAPNALQRTVELQY